MNDETKIKALMIVFTHWENESIHLRRLGVEETIECIRKIFIINTKKEDLSSTIRSFFKPNNWIQNIVFQELSFIFDEDPSFFDKHRQTLVSITNKLLSSLGGIPTYKPKPTLALKMSRRLNISLSFIELHSFSEQQLMNVDAIISIR